MISLLGPRADSRASLAVVIAVIAIIAAFFAMNFGVAAAEENLIDAVFQMKPDARGFSWHVDRNGRLTVQNAMSANQLSVNGGSFNGRIRKMTQDGHEYVLSGQANGVNVVRRIRIHPKEEVVRVVDIISNAGRTSQTFQVLLRTNFNMPATSILTDLGKPALGILDEKASGVVATMQGQAAALLFHLASPRARLRPSIVPRNNTFEFRADYKLTIPGGKSAAIIHGFSQSYFKGTPRAARLKPLFRGGSSTKWTKDLPKGVRKIFANFKGNSALDFDGTVGRISLADELGVEPLDLDILTFKEGTRMHGTVSWDELSIDTAYGVLDVPVAKAAAIVGEGTGGGVAFVYLRSGTRLKGLLRGSGVRFTMNSGLSLDLDITSMDRLVLRQSEGPKALLQGDVMLIETYRGDRLAVSSAGVQLTFAAPWGTVRLDLADIRRLLPLGDDVPGHWVELDDGNRWRVFLGGTDATALDLESELFGSVRVHLHELKTALSARSQMVDPDDAGTSPESSLEDRGVLRPHAVLSGGDVIVGPIDVEALRFLSSGGVIPVPPGQVRTLQNLSDDSQEGARIRFHAEIWGGGVIAGELQQSLLPFRTTAGVIMVPVRDIMEVNVPTPRIGGEMRTRIAELIRDLGADEWKKRELATRRLESLGALARLPIREALKQARDPEVRRRLDVLLGQMED